MNAGYVELLLRLIVDRDGSDLHLKPGSPPKIRVDGELREIPDAPELTPQEIDALADHLLTPLARRQFEEMFDADFAYAVEGVGRFRVSVFRQRGSSAVVIRRVAATASPPQELGLPEMVARLADLERGLVVVAGPTGAGKSTTLAAMIHHINRTRNVNVVTLEDPVEFLHEDIKASVSQREVGGDVVSFARGLRAVLRQDPDVIMVGEVRDTETVAACLSAAESGHLVLTSLHTIDAAETVNRMMDLFPSDQRHQARVSLAATLRGTIAQRLVPAVGGGRLPVCEVMVTTGRVQKCILEADRTHLLLDLIEDGAYYGMTSFDEHLCSLVSAGRVEWGEAMRVATRPDELKIKMRAVGLEEPTPSSYP